MPKEPHGRNSFLYVFAYFDDSPIFALANTIYIYTFTVIGFNTLHRLYTFYSLNLLVFL